MPRFLPSSSRLVDHLVPGLRRLLDQVFAVPEQLRVGVERRRVELALEGGGLDHAGEDFFGRPAASVGPFHGSIQPALANSPVQITSRPIMSIEESSAPSRRTSCSRCLRGVVRQEFGLRPCSLPFDSFVQRSATFFDRAAGLDRDERAQRRRPEPLGTAAAGS